MKNLLFFVLFIGILIVSSCSHQRMQRSVGIYNSKIMSECDGKQCSFYYTYDNYNATIDVSHTYFDYFSLFEQGVLHPALVGYFWGNKISIGSFEERRNPNDGTKRKYKFWRWCEGMANPCEYTIQLSNKNADITSSTEDFLTGATLEHISECSLII